ncbi:MAG: hypothetical protein M9945_14110 [Aquamicrobium sp.]|uniref:hypothetical protein n=1 Tax=Aquamicrobium sp. TaxID=1872579 RepID=UPI00349E7B68|nr:hypothetical protein [Aquamicrobium sp.]
MALVDPQNTLAYHQSRVLTSYRDMSNVPVHLVSAALKQFKSKDKNPGTVPEAEALWFYGLNHGMALIAAQYDPLQPLDEWDLAWVKDYHGRLIEKSLRAFYYLLLICTREARHNKSLANDVVQMTEKFGKETAQWFKMSGGEGSIHEKLLNKPPQTTIGNFVECVRWQFYNSKWNSSYGGKKWGQVTDCLCRFVKGEFSAEMMLDTVWTLSHNNGPIFNKSHFYGMYTHTLLRILDVQRSGQIPEAVLADPQISKFADAAMASKFKDLKSRFPGAIGDYVDWFVVEALGSVHKYPAEKAQQVQEHGMSVKASEAEKNAAALAQAKKEAEAAAKKAAKEQAAKEKAEFEKNWFVVMPDVQVKKIEMIREAA